MSFHQYLNDLGLPTGLTRIRTYIVAEATAQRDLLARLEFHDVAHRPLWRLDGQAGLERYSPWLFALESGSKFDAWLGLAAETMPLTVVLAHVAIDDLGRQLRRFGKFEEGGRRFFLRLGDPSSLHTYVASIAHTPPAVERLFADGDIEELYFHDPRIALARRVQPLFEQQRYEHAECDGCLVWLDALAQENA